MAATPANPQIAAWKEAFRVGEELLGAIALNQGLPGFQASVSVDGVRVADLAWGMADREAERPMTPQTLMRVASHSKTFTATAVHQLVEEGRLRLDDRLSQWIPELEGAPAGEATVSELLSHSAGIIRDGEDSDFWSLERPFPTREEVLEMARAGQVIRRNERLKYTNVGYSLLGYVVEAASGESWAERITSRILTPLTLEHTGAEVFGPGGDAVVPLEELATGYTARGANPADPFRRVPIDHVDSRGMAAATGVYSTARDLCRYFSAHLLAEGEFPRKRTKKLLADDTKRLAQRPVNTLEGRGYGLGFMGEEIGGAATFGHSGGYPGFISRTWGVQSTGVVLSVITNAIDGPAAEFGRTLFTLAELALKPADPSLKGVQRSRLRRFDATFQNLWGRTRYSYLGANIYDFELGSYADPKSAPWEFVDSRTLRMRDPYGFAAHGETSRFEFDDDGRPLAVRTAFGARMIRATSAEDLGDRVRRAY